MPSEGIIMGKIKSLGSYTRNGGWVQTNMGTWNGKEENTQRKAQNLNMKLLMRASTSKSRSESWNSLKFFKKHS
jgi:hypothetical protein